MTSRRAAALPSLMDESSGTYLIPTATSCYLISLNLKVVRRFPDAGPSAEVAALRLDNREIDLVAILNRTVGRAVELIVNLHLPTAPWTFRQLTPFVSIDRLSDVETAALL
jgi:hypothetical protein